MSISRESLFLVTLFLAVAAAAAGGGRRIVKALNHDGVVGIDDLLLVLSEWTS